MLLKIFQSSNHLEALYFSSSLWHSFFHHDFEYLVILTTFECLNQILSVLCINSCTTCSILSLLEICSIFRLLMELMSSASKFLFSSLFLIIVCFLVWICFSKITILTVSGVWLDFSLYLGWIIWLSNSTEVSWRNMRSMTKFESFWLSEYIVETWLVDLEIHKFKESAMLIRVL